MEALIVYESMFGNTRRVAEAIRDGLASRYSVELVEVGAATRNVGEDIELLVVGGPTHAFSMSRQSTRQTAIEQGASPEVAHQGIREWLEGIDAGRRPPLAAAFDTRVDKPRLPGSAAKSAARRLRRLGMTVTLPPESFRVDGMTGPLVEGELDRARRWGELLAAQLTSSRASDGSSRHPPEPG